MHIRTPPIRVDPLDHLQKIDRSQNIDGWNVQLYFLSRNPRVLLALAFVFLAIGAGLAWVFQKPVLEDVDKHFKAETLKEELNREKPDVDKIVSWLPRLSHGWGSEAPIDEWIKESHLSETEKLVATAYWNSLQFDFGFEPNADLLYYAHYVNPLRHANELIGDHYLRADDLPKAATYFRREAKFPDAAQAREKLIAVLTEQHDRKTLRELEADPVFTSSLKPERRAYFAAKEKRWADFTAPLKELLTSLINPVMMLLAAISGTVWFAIAVQAIQPPRILSLRCFLPVVGVVAGMASTFITLLGYVWVEDVLGIWEGKGLVDTFVFCMASIGPVEELVKLAFVVPFVPILLLRKSRLEMLVIAGSVGLGFAIWENLIYFKHLGAAVAMPRFLTANFFHFALTGLNGLALCDFVRNPAKGFAPFLGTLLATIAAHGGYDFMGMLGAMGGGKAFSLGAIAIFMLISLWFFRKLRDLRDGSTDHFSIAGTFVIGISILSATILPIASHQLGFELTLLIFGVFGLGMIMVGYMFYWQLGEGMSAVQEGSTVPYYR